MNKVTHEENSVRDKIMDTAIPLFAMKGFSGVTVRELSKEAGVNIALISYYFGGKEKLYAHLLTTHFDLIDAMMITIQKNELPPKERILLFQKLIIKFHGEHPFFMRLAISEIINPTSCYESIVKPGIGKLNHFLKNCVEDGIAAGEFRSDLDLAVVALSFMSVISFYFLSWPLGGDLLEKKDGKPDQYISQSFELLFRGILKKE